MAKKMERAVRVDSSMGLRCLCVAVVVVVRCSSLLFDDDMNNDD